MNNLTGNLVNAVKVKSTCVYGQGILGKENRIQRYFLSVSSQNIQQYQISQTQSKQFSLNNDFF